MPKYSDAALSKVFLDRPIVWNFLVRLFEKAVSFKNRGLVASEQSQSAFVYGGVYTLSFAVLWHLAFVLLLWLNFSKVFYDKGWQSLLCSTASLGFFHFLLSEQTKNKASTCRTRLLFFPQQMKTRDFGRMKACLSPHVTIYVTYFLQLSKLPLKNLHFCNRPMHHFPPQLRPLPLATVQWRCSNSSEVCRCDLKWGEVKPGDSGWGQSSWHGGAVCLDSWMSLYSGNSLLPAAAAAASTTSALLLLFFSFSAWGSKSQARAQRLFFWCAYS